MSFSKHKPKTTLHETTLCFHNALCLFIVAGWASLIQLQLTSRSSPSIVFLYCRGTRSGFPSAPRICQAFSCLRTSAPGDPLGPFPSLSGLSRPPLITLSDTKLLPLLPVELYFIALKCSFICLLVCYFSPSLGIWTWSVLGVTLSAGFGIEPRMVGAGLIYKWVGEWKSLSHVRLFAIPWTVVHGVLQVRILECVAFPFSRGSSQTRDQTQVSHLAGRFFTSLAIKEPQEYWDGQPIPSPADLPDPGIEPGSLHCRRILYLPDTNIQMTD